MDKLKGIAIGGAAALIIIGGLIYSQADKLFPDEPRGPGSDDFYEKSEHDPMTDGPGSGEFAEPEPQGPGSDDFYSKLEDEDPTGPGSGQFAEPEPQGPGSDDFYSKLEDEDPTGPGSGEEATAVGSCNVIDGSSICTDYVGSYWATPEVVALNCQGVGVYNTEACPQPTAGGCQNLAGSAYETIVWYYPYGGEPITGELINYAAGTCGAVGGNYLYND